jgi:hypothetical protein
MPLHQQRVRGQEGGAAAAAAGGFMGDTAAQQAQQQVRVGSSVLGIRDMLVRIRILGSVPLTNRSDSFLQWYGTFRMPEKKSFFFLITYPQAQFKFWLKFCLKFYFESIISVRSTTFMRKGKDPYPYR